MPTVPAVPVTATNPRAVHAAPTFCSATSTPSPISNRAEYESSTWRSGASALTSIDALTERNGPSHTRS